MKYYKSYRIIDGKPRWVIVDETGNIVNINPSKEELKGLEDEPYKYGKCGGSHPKYTDKELLYFPIQFFEENGRVPVRRDFENNPRYPYYSTYTYRFGSWNNALKLVGMDLDTIVKQGNLENSNQKARYAEIKVINHFKQHPVDLAGENRISSCDGICPNGKTYDVKSSKLDPWKKRYTFNTRNKYKEEIEIYYFLAFNEDYSKLRFVWRVPGEIVEKDYFHVALNNSYYEFTVENMKEYDITDKFKDVIKI